METAPFSTRRPAKGPAWMLFLRPVASLRLTVALFFLSIILVLMGTLAQTKLDMWEVIWGYFRSWIAWVDVASLFPEAFFPGVAEKLPFRGRFPFPGGYILGGLLSINLLAAHLVRFKVQARGIRLAAGLLFMALGVLVTSMIIASGHNSNGIQETFHGRWDTAWNIMKLLLVAIWICTLVGTIRMSRSQNVEWGLMLATCVGIGLVVVYLLVRGDAAALNASSMRILWQLILGSFAACILLIGCSLLFKLRGGVVLIHLGVGLLMCSELITIWAVEEQMQIGEGQTVNFARDTRDVELAVVDRSHPENDTGVSIPSALLQRSLDEAQPIQHESLPFDLEVLNYFENSRPVSVLDAQEANRATTGTGLRYIAVEEDGATGVDASGAVDMAAAYVRLIPKSGNATPDVLLLSQHFGDGELFPSIRRDAPESFRDENGREYEVSLRFRRNFKPYSVKLLDLVKEDYQGTNTPRDYSSYVHLVDKTRGTDRDDIRIWMNNPLRYAGETFYQSNYTRDPPSVANQTGREFTTLQIVTNFGWMIPYISCMIVMWGLIAHFLITLTRFLRRQLSTPTQKPINKPTDDSTDSHDKPSKSREASPVAQPARGQPAIVAMAIPIIVVLLALMVIFRAASMPKSKPGDMNLDEFAQLPVVFEGRVKPMDTLARNVVQLISDKQSVKDANDEKRSPVRWALDIISGHERAEEYSVVRIENLDVLELFDLERRKGFRYSIADLSPGFDKFLEAAQKARQAKDGRGVENIDAVDRNVLETEQRLQQYQRFAQAMRPLPFPAIPDAEELQKDPEAAEAARQRLAEFLRFVPAANERIMSMEPPLIVPLADADDDSQWVPYAAAVNRAYVSRAVLDQAADPRTVMWLEMLDAYAGSNPKEFNAALASYQQDLIKSPPEGYNPTRVRFEAFFNHFAPFFISAMFYLIAFALTCFSWLSLSRTLRWSATALIILTFLLHTFAIVSRIYISGRPPVTNLYSSAVFIGWGCVCFGLSLEAIFRIGIGNMLSSIAGFATLLVAHLLSLGGDTFTVLQAVLDTQFWLATHVVCITYGYSATFAAGILGVSYVIARVFVPGLDAGVSRTLARMIYGILCFAILFSFVGTVLGGLWADDSWGRFWGWDPKENGALIIVLWNALVLHARWGGMVRERGLAILAIGGNIWTSLSWFGVNELNIGLHSYGGSGVSARFALEAFWVSQVVIALIGVFLIPSKRTNIPSGKEAASHLVGPAPLPGAHAESKNDPR